MVRDGPRTPPVLRSVTLAMAGFSAVFLLYTFYAIWNAPRGDGTGFQVLAVVPLGLIFIVFTVPATALAVNRYYPKTALVLGLLGLLATQWLWWGDLIYELHIY